VLRGGAQECAGQTTPPAPVGSAIVLTAHTRQRSAWLLSFAEPTHGLATGTLSADAERTIQRAHRLLSMHATLAWRDLAPPGARSLGHLDTVFGEASVVERRPVAGDSLGLSAVLALSSMLYDKSLPGDIACSAAIDDNGALAPVGRVAKKVATVVECLPGIRRLIVAKRQEGEWRRHAEPLGLTVRGFRTVGDAISELLDPAGALADTPPKHQPEVLYGFTELLRGGRSKLLWWDPVGEAVRKISTSWELTEDQRAEMALVQLVADRYAQRPIPDTEAEITEIAAWIRRRPALNQPNLLAHLVQHHATYGLPLPHALEVTVSPMIAARDAPFAYRLRGAWGRWLASMDRSSEAYRVQRSVLEELHDARLGQECSYALTECLRLAGALGRRGDFEQLLGVETALRRVGALCAADRMYVDAYVAWGAALLGDLNQALARRQKVLAAAGLPNQRNLASRTLRVIRFMQNAQDVDGREGLVAVDRALDELRCSRISSAEAFEVLGSTQAVARRLHHGGVDHLHRFLPI